MTRPVASAPVEAVALDLFGTLVDAPTDRDRREFCRGLADLLDVSESLVAHLVRHSWLARHDGTLPTTGRLATYLARLLTGTATAAGEVAAFLSREAGSRLSADGRVVATLEALRLRGLRIGVLSDASADIAEAWPACKLAPLVDTAIFSAAAGAVKPAPTLYRRLLRHLDVPAAALLYCGDGGGDELGGARACGISAVAVPTRGTGEVIVIGARDWPGERIGSIEELPDFVDTRNGTP